MGPKIRAALNFLFQNFGPLIVFYTTYHFWGLKPAIVISTGYALLEIGLHIYRKKPLTRLFKCTAAVTLVFGIVDIYSQQSFLFKYEAATTSIMMGCFFGSSLVGEKTVIEELAEKDQDSSEVTPELKSYFRFLTLAWVGYFFVKACVYFWIARNYTLNQGIVIRTLVGSGSLYFMIFVSIFGSRKIFPFLRDRGFLTSS